MSPDPGDWVELSLRCPAADPAPVLGPHVVPFLEREWAAGRIGPPALLREPGGATAVLVVQARRADEPPGDLPGRWRSVAAAAGAAAPHVGPAVAVPLAGSGFDGPGLAPAARDFLAAAAPAVLPAAAAATRAARLAAAADLVVAHLPAVAARTVPGANGGAPLSFLSLRSHAEGFLASTKDPVAARRALDQRYAALAGYLEPRTVQVVTQVRGGPAVSAGAGCWAAAARQAKPGLAEQFRRGRIRPPADPDGAAGPLDRSAFHSVVRRSAGLQDFLGHDPDFLATRTLTSLLYLTLHTIGISLMERYLLCHAVSRACEVVFDVAADDALAAVARDGPGGGPVHAGTGR